MLSEAKHLETTVETLRSAQSDINGIVNMQTLKLLSAFFKVNVQMSLAYRADTVVNILLNLMWLGWELLSLNIIFSNTETRRG